MSATGPRVRRSRQIKLAVVRTAEAVGVSEAARLSGVPRTTITEWMSTPENVIYRQKTREDLAEEARVMAHATLATIQARLAEFDPRDLSVLFGILVDKGQLLSGAATARVETRELTDALNDHERQTLRDAIDAFLKEADAVPA